MGGGQLNKPGTVRGSACPRLLSGRGETWGAVGFHPQCARDCEWLCVTACTRPVYVKYVCIGAEPPGPNLALQQER